MKKVSLPRSLTLLLIFSVSGGFSSHVLGQKRSDRGTGEDKTRPSAPVGPKRTDRAIPESERVKVITKTEFVKVAVRPNKAYLSVVAIPTAIVTLTPVTTNQKKTPALKHTVKDQDGSLNLINLLPGKYKIVIEHPDYDPYSDTIQIDPARPDIFVAYNKMVARYGAIRIGGTPANAKIYLDDALVPPSRLTMENQNAVIPKIPVGKHSLRISKTGYADFSREIDVTPGKQAFVSAQLELARVTLNLTSEPGARIYVGDEEKAIIPSNGNVTISLEPGRHDLRVSKDAYQEWRKELTLSLANNPVAERVNLIPIPNSTEGDWQPALGPRKWRPQPAAWKFDASGAHIRGDQLSLFNTEAGRDFNTYRDFKLEFDVVFTNGKGVSWVARAKDRNNYYLFEIGGPRSGKPIFNFYICQDGKLELKDSRPIVVSIDKPGDSFHIIFEARGGRFDTRMIILSAPSAKPSLIGISQDDSFSYGGVGFRGKDQSDSLLQTFFVIPLSR
ncbi:MAG TPA: carboxypeptidase regulatory-like domain-containing protein [Blastocatellia bacterium]|nr:carboxypeptidase regulatory-like domain-containing protein [Blastocatellia bacterium]